MQNEYVRVAITMADGSVGLMQFNTLAAGSVLPFGAEWVSPGVWKREQTDAAVFAEVARAHPDAIKFRLVHESEVPADRDFRDALVDDGKALAHDMERAREIHRERLRAERAPMLAKLDVDAIRAQTESRDEVALAGVIAEKQRLRDITADPRIEAATTIEELKAIVLGG